MCVLTKIPASFLLQRAYFGDSKRISKLRVHLHRKSHANYDINYGQGGKVTAKTREFRHRFADLLTGAQVIED